MSDEEDGLFEDILEHVKVFVTQPQKVLAELGQAFEDLPDDFQQDAEKGIDEVVDVAKELVSSSPVESLNQAVVDVYEETKDIVSNPGEVLSYVQVAANESIRDIDEMMKQIRENSSELGKNVEEAMESLATKSDSFLYPTSQSDLVDAEVNALKDIQLKYTTMDVVVDDETGDTIHTVCFESQEKDQSNTPLLMIHGLGGGLPCFHKNYSSLSSNRNVYGIDIPGFALSSRMKTSTNAKECLNKIIDLLDKWRKAMNIDKFILLGHSFGGYISAAYTAKNPSHIKHLILADPWGVIPKEEDHMREDPKVWEKAAMAISNLMRANPFSIIRNIGPLGPILNDQFVPDEIRSAYGNDCIRYFYHAIARDNASGEAAFSVISDFQYIWPAEAMKPHLIKLTPSVHITFIYGEKSPYHNIGGADIKQKRANVFVPKPVPEAGHHVQAQNPDEFNQRVRDVLCMVDADTSTAY